MRSTPATLSNLLSAAAAVLAGAPTPVTAPLSLLAFAVVAERLVRVRDHNGADALLAGTGGLLVALILDGFLLGVTRIGLRPATWALSLGVIGLVGLVLVEWLAPASTRRRPPWLRPRAGLDAGWALATGAVLVAALVISVVATHRADVAPVQMSFGTISGSSVQVVVSADQATGELDLASQAADGTSVTYPLFTVRPGSPVTTSLVLPQRGRFVITLSYSDQTTPLRTLILDR
jgi:hypothetical protein